MNRIHLRHVPLHLTRGARWLLLVLALVTLAASALAVSSPGFRAELVASVTREPDPVLAISAPAVVRLGGCSADLVDEGIPVDLLATEQRSTTVWLAAVVVGAGAPGAVTWRRVELVPDVNWTGRVEVQGDVGELPAVVQVKLRDRAERLRLHCGEEE